MLPSSLLGTGIMRWVYGFRDDIYSFELWFASQKRRSLVLEADRIKALQNGFTVEEIERDIYPLRRFVASASGKTWLAKLQAGELSRTTWKG